MPRERVRAKSGWEPYYRVVRKIPRGKVTTYGRVAALAGRPGAARLVGYALAALRGTGGRGVPWQRVLGSRGPALAAISLPSYDGGDRQRALLEAEGVRVDERGRVSLQRYGWPPLRVSRSSTPSRPAKATPNVPRDPSRRHPRSSGRRRTGAE